MNTKMLHTTSNLASVPIMQPPVTPAVVIPYTAGPWYEVVGLAFQLLVSRARQDEELHDFLTDTGVVVTGYDGQQIWPPVVTDNNPAQDDLSSERD